MSLIANAARPPRRPRWPLRGGRRLKGGGGPFIRDQAVVDRWRDLEKRRRAWAAIVRKFWPGFGT